MKAWAPSSLTISPAPLMPASSLAPEPFKIRRVIPASDGRVVQHERPLAAVEGDVEPFEGNIGSRCFGPCRERLHAACALHLAGKGLGDRDLAELDTGCLVGDLWLPVVDD